MRDAWYLAPRAQQRQLLCSYVVGIWSAMYHCSDVTYRMDITWVALSTLERSLGPQVNLLFHNFPEHWIYLSVAGSGWISDIRAFKWIGQIPDVTFRELEMGTYSYIKVITCLHPGSSTRRLPVYIIPLSTGRLSSIDERRVRPQPVVRSEAVRTK